MMNKSIYSHFHQCAEVIADIEAIDYFFAKELTQRLSSAATSSSDVEQLFHLLMALSKGVRQGNTCLCVTNIAQHSFGYAADHEGVVTHNGFVFTSAQKLTELLDKLGVLPDDNTPIVWDNGQLYLRRYFTHQQQLVDHFKARINRELKLSGTAISDITLTLKSLFPEQYQTLANGTTTSSTEIDYQLLAVANALNKNFTVIAGGPGTGKTYTVTKLLAALIMQATRKETVESSNALTDERESQILENRILENQIVIKLVAPTGKAAQRLSESIGQAVSDFKGRIADDVLTKIPQTAQTIHRLLGVIPNSPNYRFNKENKLQCDVLIIDEVSMVDLSLMTRLFNALPENCNVIMLGDADQLPSVALGSVLNDICIRPHLGYSKANADYLQQVTGFKQIPIAKKTTADHLVILQQSRRFDGEGAIGQLAKWVIASNSHDSWQLLKSRTILAQTMVAKTSFTQALNETDVYSLPSIVVDSKGSKPSTVTEQYPWLPYFVERYYRPLLDEQNISKAFRLLSEFRVLCAMRVGEQGIDHINNLVIELLGKSRTYESSSRLKPLLFHGLPIMITENNYSLNLYNGDLGLVWKNEAGHLTALFEDPLSDTGYRSIIPSRLPTYDHVYAMTIHKTQGSEFAHVLMVLPQQSDNRMLSRELIYTGLTRAKKQLGIVSSQKTWNRGVEAQVKRDSGLYEKLFNEH